MRVMLFTGKGGVGKTTLAAGTAALAAERGEKTLVLSTDPPTPWPTPLWPGRTCIGSRALEVARICGHCMLMSRPLCAGVGEIQQYLLEVLDSAGSTRWKRKNSPCCQVLKKCLRCLRCAIA